MTELVAAELERLELRAGARLDRRMVFVNRFFHPDVSATSQLLSELAFALAAKGLDVHVIASRNDYQSSKSELPAEEIINGVRIHRIWTSDFGRNHLAGRSIDYLTFYVFAFWALLKWLRPGDIAITKTDPPLISVVAMVASKLRRASQVNWLQDLFPEVAAASGFKTVRGPFKWLLSYVRDLSLHHAKCNIVIGKLMKAKLLARGIPEGQIQVIQNWAVGDVVPVAHSDNPLRSEWELDGHFVVGYSGNLGRAHDYDIIVNAAEALRKNAKIKFLFIGSGKHTRALQREVTRRKLSNFVFKPYQPAEQLKFSLSAVDLHIVILRPEFEGLIVPSKFYGIAAAARPTLVVGSSTGEISSLIDSCTEESMAVNSCEKFVSRVLIFSEQTTKSNLLGQAMLTRYGSRSRFSNAVDSWAATLAAETGEIGNRVPELRNSKPT